MTKNNNGFDIEYLEYKIKQAQEHNEPIDNYVLREISWLQQQLDIFLEKSKEEGKDIEPDFDIAEIAIRQYAAMKQLAQQINHPCDIYDEKIKQVQIRCFGEEGYKQFFGG